MSAQAGGSDGGLGALRHAVAGFDPLVGTTVDRWVLEEALGRGGIGAVYRGRHVQTGALAAVKILSPRASDALTRGANAERFRRGVREAARIQHPNVVSILDAGQTVDGTWFVVMRLVRGRSLEGHVRERGRLPAAEARAVVAEIAAALEPLHAAGIVHRDVKPSNILRDEEGRHLLTDFDLVRPLETADAGAVTREGAAVGTAAYMSPEQIAGEPVDHRTDLFSLGSVWYELLTGSTPFGRGSWIELAARIARAEVPDISVLLPDLTDADAALLRSLLAKERDDRPASADAVRVAIEGSAASAATSTATSTRRETGRVRKARTSDRARRRSGRERSPGESGVGIPTAGPVAAVFALTVLAGVVFARSWGGEPGTETASETAGAVTVDDGTPASARDPVADDHGAIAAAIEGGEHVAALERLGAPPAGVTDAELEALAATLLASIERRVERDGLAHLAACIAVAPKRIRGRLAALGDEVVRGALADCGPTALGAKLADRARAGAFEEATATLLRAEAALDALLAQVDGGPLERAVRSTASVRDGRRTIAAWRSALSILEGVRPALRVPTSSLGTRWIEARWGTLVGERTEGGARVTLEVPFARLSVEVLADALDAVGGPLRTGLVLALFGDPDRAATLIAAREPEHGPFWLSTLGAFEPPEERIVGREPLPEAPAAQPADPEAEAVDPPPADPPLPVEEWVVIARDAAAEIRARRQGSSPEDLAAIVEQFRRIRARMPAVAAVSGSLDREDEREVWIATLVASSVCGGRELSLGAAAQLHRLGFAVESLPFLPTLDVIYRVVHGALFGDPRRATQLLATGAFQVDGLFDPRMPELLRRTAELRAVGPALLSLVHDDDAWAEAVGAAVAARKEVEAFGTPLPDTFTKEAVATAFGTLRDGLGRWDQARAAGAPILIDLSDGLGAAALQAEPLAGWVVQGDGLQVVAEQREAFVAGEVGLRLDRAERFERIEVVFAPTDPRAVALGFDVRGRSRATGFVARGGEVVLVRGAGGLRRFFGVEAYLPGGAPAPGEVVDEAATLRLSRVERGRVTVTVAREGQPPSEPVVVRPDADGGVTVHLRPSAGTVVRSVALTLAGAGDR